MAKEVPSWVPNKDQLETGWEVSEQTLADLRDLAAADQGDYKAVVGVSGDAEPDTTSEEVTEPRARGNVIVSVGNAKVLSLGQTITVEGGTEEDRARAYSQYLRALNGE